ncbi:MAG: ABC transporter permease [Planctomycetes bacterium]|nr:ABC transporter permease [Planctomycetota bacterium]
MAPSKAQTLLSRLLAEHGMLLVLLVLCAYYSWATFAVQHPAGAAGGEQLAREISSRFPPPARVLVVARDTEEDAAFAGALRQGLEAAGLEAAAVVYGQPADAREALEGLEREGRRLDAIACNQTTASWAVFDGLAARLPALGGPPVVQPASYRWPNFLKAENLLNVANQISVIAIVAIGMTLVIIAAGIDLSVGSLIALSAVASTLLVRDLGGGESATALAMTLSCLGGIVLCGLVGLFSGAMVTAFGIPSFIVTLAMMLVASGLAFQLAEGQSIYQVPDSFVWLGRGSTLRVPNAVLLMAVLYAAAHVLMTRTVLGRYVYAVGGNPEAARLSGVPVRHVILFVYGLCGALAGSGGVVMASQLKSGAPTYGQMYELYVIAAVVVGGASLSGGEGKVLGTLIGAFIIAVIQNGMNLTGVESYTQKVVLGLVILGAVLLDTVKKRGWSWILRKRGA